MRAAVVLRYYEDMTEAEVAEVLGVSLGTVKSTVSRAVAKLRIDAELLAEVTYRPAGRGTIRPQGTCVGPPRRRATAGTLIPGRWPCAAR